MKKKIFFISFLLLSLLFSVCASYVFCVSEGLTLHGFGKFLTGGFGIRTVLFIGFTAVFTAALAIVYLLFTNCRIQSVASGTVSKLSSKLSPQASFAVYLSAAILLTNAVIYTKLVIDRNTLIYNDIGGDTLCQYFPVYTFTAGRIRNGSIFSSLYSLVIGYGSRLSNFAGNMNTPLIFLTILFPTAIFGDSFIAYSFIIYRIACSFISGLLCYRYLKCFSDKYAVNAVVSYIFAFNGFYMIWGQHYFFSEYCIYELLVLIGIEEYLRRDNRFCISLFLSSFMCMLLSIYISYIIFFPAAFYAIFRYFMIFEKPQIRHFIPKFVSMASQILLGFGCAALFALPNIASIFSSGRVLSNESLLDVFITYLKTWYFSNTEYYLQRTVSSGLLGRGGSFTAPTNYYEAVQMFFSAFAVMIPVQYVFNIRLAQRSVRQMILRYVCWLLCIFAVFNKGFAFAMYAFSAVANRQQFVLFPFLAVIAVSVINDAVYNRIFSKAGFACGCIISLAAAVLSIGKGKTNTFFALFVIGVIAAGSALMMIGLKTRNIKAGFALCLLLFANITGEMLYATDRNGGNININDYRKKMSSVADTIEALDKLYELDSDLFRTEKTYYDVTYFSDSLFGNYNSVSFYNSTLTPQLRYYIEKYTNPKYIYNKRGTKVNFIHSPNDYVIYSQLGMKYLLSRTPVANDAVFEYVTTVNDISVYRNRYSDSFTTFYDYAVSDSDFMQYAYNDRNRILQAALVVNDDSGIPQEYIHSADEFTQYEDVAGMVLDEAGLSAYSSVRETSEMSVLTFRQGWYDSTGTDAYAELSLKPANKSDIKATFKVFTTDGQSVNYPVTVSGGREFQTRYILPRSTERIEFQLSDTENCTVKYLNITSDSYPLKSNDNPVTFDYTGNDMKLSGHINCDRKGLLFIPMLFNDKMIVNVDNEPVQVYEANSAFMCIEMSEGEHSIDILYDPYIEYTGLAVSAGSMLTSLVYFLISKKKKITPAQSAA